MFIYKTTGTCSKEIQLEIDNNDIIKSVTFVGGCRGNTKGVAALCIGRNAHDVAKMLRAYPARAIHPVLISFPRPYALTTLPSKRHSRHSIKAVYLLFSKI